MNWRKAIIFLIVLIMFLISIQRVFINVFFYNKGNLDTGIVYEVDEYNDVEGNSSMTSFYVKNSNDIKFEGQYHYKREYFIKIGDTLVFRKLYNGSVRPIKKNGTVIQSYYGFWDYGSVIFLIILIFVFFYLPKILNKIKNEDNFN